MALPKVKPTKEPVPCEYPGCGMEFGRRPDMMRHKNNIHKPPKKCPIDNCEFEIRKRDSLNAHLTEHGFTLKEAIILLETLDSGTQVAYAGLPIAPQANMHQWIIMQPSIPETSNELLNSRHSGGIESNAPPMNLWAGNEYSPFPTNFGEEPSNCEYTPYSLHSTADGSGQYSDLSELTLEFHLPMLAPYFHGSAAPPADEYHDAGLWAMTSETQCYTSATLSSHNSNNKLDHSSALGEYPSFYLRL